MKGTSPISYDYYNIILYCYYTDESVAEEIDEYRLMSKELYFRTRYPLDLRKQIYHLYI